ncbi:hypothetical protein DL764_004692 [Monosporascus ibericus]|uniref:Uncharacterized protein n=1 Tax=Monosporascus ibericus TaxID=155417 RepID=A0A4Q4TDL1_9PEZI|nr:hypothetical protein DL764_004692 [Monosporascus ibericus]
MGARQARERHGLVQLVDERVRRVLLRNGPDIGPAPEVTIVLILINPLVRYVTRHERLVRCVELETLRDLKLRRMWRTISVGTYPKSRALRSRGSGGVAAASNPSPLVFSNGPDALCNSSLSKFPRSANRAHPSANWPPSSGSRLK